MRRMSFGGSSPKGQIEQPQPYQSACLPRRVVVLARAQLVAARVRRAAEQRDGPRAEAAERLEEQLVDLGAVCLRAAVCARLGRDV